MKETLSLKLKHFFVKYSIASTLVAITIILCLFDTTLFSIRNMRNIASNAAPIFLMSAGMALCLYSGKIDLSAGAISAFAGIITGSFVQRLDAAGRLIPFLPPLPAFIVIPLVLTLFYGLGVVYAKFIYAGKSQPWFFTLAASSVLMGLGHIFLSTSNIGTPQITGFTNQFLQFGVGYIGTSPTYSIPLTLLITIAALIGLWLYLRKKGLLLKRTESDITKRNTKKNISIIFGCSTTLFALAGIMITARNAIATPTIGMGLTTDAIAICLMARFSLKGGKGTLRSIIVMTIIYMALIYCLTYVGVNEYVSLVIRGIILICTMELDSRVFTKKEVAED